VPVEDPAAIRLKLDRLLVALGPLRLQERLRHRLQVDRLAGERQEGERDQPEDEPRAPQLQASLQQLRRRELDRPDHQFGSFRYSVRSGVSEIIFNSLRTRLSIRDAFVSLVISSCSWE